MSQPSPPDEYAYTWYPPREPFAPPLTPFRSRLRGWPGRAIVFGQAALYLTIQVAFGLFCAGMLGLSLYVMGAMVLDLACRLVG